MKLDEIRDERAEIDRREDALELEGSVDYDEIDEDTRDFQRRVLEGIADGEIKDPVAAARLALGRPE